MAMLDYGALTWKDGVLVSETEFFDDMQEMVGWNDEGQEHQMKNNWFSFIGDEDLTIAFYKYCMKVYCPKEYYNDTVYFGADYYVGWKKWKREFFVDNHFAKLVVKPARFGDYYIATLRYKKHKWKVAFGSGVCHDTYTKYHIMSAWNMPSHRWYKFKMSVRHFIDYEWRYPEMWGITCWFRGLKWDLRRNKYD